MLIGAQQSYFFPKTKRWRNGSEYLADNQFGVLISSFTSSKLHFFETSHRSRLGCFAGLFRLKTGHITSVAVLATDSFIFLQKRHSDLNIVISARSCT